MVRALLHALPVLAGLLLAAGAAAVEAAPGAHLEAARKLSAQLLALRGPRDITAVPPTAVRLLPALRTELRAAAEAVALARPGAAPEALDADLATLLGEAGLHATEAAEDEGAETTGSRYGRVEAISFDAVPDHPELLVLRVALRIPYGDDTALYLYRREGVIRVLSLEPPRYTRIDGALSRLQYVVSPPRQDGGAFLLAASVSPWPSSNWQTLRYVALRPGANADRPVRFDRTAMVYLGADEPFRLRAGPHEFTVSYEGATFDTGLIVRAHVERWAERAVGWSRVSPLAAGPVDFLDEWRALPWTQAAPLVAPGAPPAVRRLHRRLSGRNARAQSPLAVEATVAQACPGGGRWQVTLTILTDGGEEDVFVEVSRSGDDFFVAWAGSARRPGCPGDDAPTQLPLLQ